MIDPSQKVILLTGVSSGIGYDAVSYLTKQGYFVFGSVRSNVDQERLEKKFPNNFKALFFDVTDKDAILSASSVVKELMPGRNLTALVNNAGLAVPGPMQFIDDQKFRSQIEIGLFGVRNVINAFLPLLGASGTISGPTKNQNPGKIINISSISGILNTPMNGAYCVAKHAMESIGEVYRRELYQYGIDVISIQPGPIKSEIWSKNAETVSQFAQTDYKNMVVKTNKIMQDAQRDALPAEIISRLIDNIIKKKRPKTAYIIHKNVLTVTIMAKFLPARLVDWLLYKSLT